MARTPSAAAAATTNGVPTPARRKSARPLGPRMLYIILKEGTDASAVRGMIAKVTFNGRTVLNSMEDGQPVPMLRLPVDVEKRDGGDAPLPEVSDTSQADAAQAA